MFWVSLSLARQVAVFGEPGGGVRPSRLCLFQPLVGFLDRQAVKNPCFTAHGGLNQLTFDNGVGHLGRHPNVDITAFPPLERPLKMQMVMAARQQRQLVNNQRGKLIEAHDGATVG